MMMTKRLLAANSAMRPITVNANDAPNVIIRNQMPTLIVGLIALYLLLAAIKQFGRMSPATAARSREFIFDDMSASM